MPDQDVPVWITAPTDASSFVGRKHEMSEVRRLLSRTRLLTLTGPGGVGKTRLAFRVARTVRGRFPDGVEIVELAALDEGGLLVPAVAAALGLREGDRQVTSPSAEVTPLLADYLADRRTLLVLDNCEHLLQTCADLVNDLLRAAPRLRVLTTSRHRLGLTGERVLAIPSLTVVGEYAPVREIARCESVRLFSDRAAIVNPDFTVTAANAPTLARISQRLDGIPLAIELAAARLRTTPIDQLLRELDDRFTTLTDGSTTALPRHQTLRATMDWSHDLCSPAEQHLWARLATFPGGVDLDTAEEICSGNGIARDEIFDLISGLVDKSVLTTQQTSTTTRYRMLDSIRAYGREHLTPSEETTLRHARCAHYRRLADANRIDRVVPDQVYRFWLLQTEIANLRVALDSCFTGTHDPGAGLDIASSMWSYWVITGTLTEGRHWLDRGLALTSPGDPVRFTALWADALLALYQGDAASARTWVAECRALAKQSGDESSLAFALQIAGVTACSTGDPKKGYALLEEARNRHRALGDLDALALNLYLASVYCSATAPHEAAVLGEQLIALCNERGAPLFRSYAQFGVAMAAWIQGDWRHTEAMMRQVAIPWTVINDRWGLVQFLEVMAWTAGRRGDHLRAARLLGAADAVWQAVHASPMVVRYSEESHRSCVERTRQALGGRAFADAFRSGARLGLDHAIAFALEEEPAVAATAF